MSPKTNVPARILVVDDNAENRRLFAMILDLAHYAVEAVGDGLAALERVRESPPDLILLDVMMPGLDGYEVCRRLKADPDSRDIPVIFATALGDQAAETRGFDAGGVDFLTKPLHPQVVLARVAAQLALAAQRRNLEGMFRDVMEFAPDAIILTDPEGRIVQINARTEELFGWPRGELQGQPVERLMPQALRARHEGHRRDFARGAGTLRMASGAACLRRDGSEFFGDISLTTLQTPQGPLLMAVVRDVTERKRQEERLVEAARYARSLIETSIDPLILIDMQGRIQDANEAACRITGLPREELIGSDAASKFTEPERLKPGFKQVMAEGQAIDYLLTIRHAGGRLTDVLCNARAYRNEHGEVVGIFATAHDVTESRRIQEEVSTSRQRLRDMAAQSEAMREYERKSIAREVHDELGQVLTALRMDLTFLDLRFGAEAPELQAKFRDMRGLVDRAIQGVRNVATNLRPSALDMGLIPAIEWVCGEFTRHTGIPCAVLVEGQGLELPEARAIGLFRIVQESLTNVTRYAQAQRVQVTLRGQEETLTLQVQDDGLGFDPEAARRRNAFGLLGMQERALALGGTLQVQSARGQGTTIRVTVPLHHVSRWQEFA